MYIMHTYKVKYIYAPQHIWVLMRYMYVIVWLFICTNHRIWKSKIILIHRDRDFILYVKFLCMLFDFMTILISQCFKVRLVFTISVVWITTIFLFCNFLWNHFSSNSGQAVNSASTPKTNKKQHKEKRGAINLSWK